MLTEDCYSYSECEEAAKILFNAVDEYGKMVGEDGNASFWEGVEEWWDQGYDWLYKLVGDTNHMNSYRVGEVMNITKNYCTQITSMGKETGDVYFKQFGFPVKTVEGKSAEEVNTAIFFFYYKFTYYATTYEGSTDVYTPAYTLRETIAKWYVVLLRIALVGMLSMLVYIGIRIIITSASQDKAKYKKMLVDWLVAICLLLFMNYIMAFSVNFVEKITELINYMDVNDYMNIVRNHAGINNDIVKSLGYTVIYVCLIVLTVNYTFSYLKRVIYMAFLTMISPLVAFTYPLDKLNDGQAQAFNMWIKEYMFTLLLQPMHLLLYTVLMGSAAELAKSNLIYALVVLAFMTQAEKIVRKFFGFEKAQAPGLLAGPGGGPLMMEAFKKLTGWGPRSKSKKYII